MHLFAKPITNITGYRIGIWTGWHVSWLDHITWKHLLCRGGSLLDPQPSPHFKLVEEISMISKL
jgi:hypothetical protein